MSDHPVVTGEAWRSFCDRIAAVGRAHPRATDFPPTDADRAEGVHHLADAGGVLAHVRDGLQRSRAARVLSAAATPTYRWGGPNVDQVARRAAIAGDGAYRVSGGWGRARSSSCRSRAVRSRAAAPTSTPRSRRRASASAPATPSRSSSAGPAATAGGSPLDPSARVRARARLLLRLGRRRAAGDVRHRAPRYPGSPAVRCRRRTRRRDARRTRPGRSSTRSSSGTTTRRACATRRRPTVSACPAVSGRGACRTSSTATGSSRLRDDEAMVLELDPNDAALWDIQLYNRVWYEPLDYAHRVTSRNHRQVVADGDGLVRIVVAGRDPGTANWLDTEGRAEVLTTVRWWRPENPRSAPRSSARRLSTRCRSDIEVRRRRTTPRRDRRRAPRTSRGGSAHDRRLRTWAPAPDGRREAGVTGIVDTDIEGRVVVVTGASKGVGRGIARHLATRARARDRDRGASRRGSTRCPRSSTASAPRTSSTTRQRCRPRAG